jgi:hypothetical protein
MVSSGLKTGSREEARDFANQSEHVLRFGALTRGQPSRRARLTRLPTEAASEASVWRRLAERVGVFDRDLAKANEINGFAIISRNRNDLASSNLRRRFRPFAGFCRFFHFNDTRNALDGKRSKVFSVDKIVETSSPPPADMSLA